jgi:hypothetical protein
MRLSYAAVGGVAGASAWLLIEVVPEMIGNSRLVLLVVAAGLGFFSMLLALLGPVRLIPAVAAAIAMAVPAAVLLLWASFRHVDVDGFLGHGYAPVAFVYLLAIAAPFAVAALQRHGGWRHYGILFDAAWALVVRVAAAWLFVGIVWGVLLLSDALLGLVGLDIIEDLIELDAVPYLISGATLGLGLAIVYELRDYVSPFLVVQLLRALLPALLVVLTVFILALPFRGLGNLFGQLSAAATLMGVTAAGITLVTTAIHRDDASSVEGPVMRGATWALSLMLPVPALLALWAVSLRVGQYGLTPDRVAALVAAGVASIYALAYAGSALRRSSWRAKQRHVNRWMVLATLALAALWLTPVLDAERLSTSSQITRAERGAPPQTLALWEMANDWGKAGQRGLARLEARAEADGDEALVALIDRARWNPQKWKFLLEEDDADIVALDGLVPLHPEGRTLPPGALDALGVEDRRMIANACKRRVVGGHPGCVMVIAQYEPEGGAAEQVIGFFMMDYGSVRIVSFAMRDGALFIEGYPHDLVQGVYTAAEPEIIGDILEGRFSIVPAPRNVLEVDGLRLFPQ